MSADTCAPGVAASERASMLAEVQRLPTSGARAVEQFTDAGVHYLAVPQLAADVEGQHASMTAGDSDVETIVYRWHGEKFVEHQRLPVPGGEDAEFFTIGDRPFLATASLRSGSGPYNMELESVIWEMRGGRFEPCQSIPTFAAKQWKHFAIGSRHFLALAQGVAGGEAPLSRNGKSCIYEWDGARFVLFQEVPSAWGYNWLFLELDGRSLLAYADHVEASRLLTWTGSSFEPLQEFEGASGRAFCCFRAKGEYWLAFANLLGDSRLYRWNGGRFIPYQVLSGPGGREFAWIAHSDAGYLVQVNFIHGTRESPQPSLRSSVFAWRHAGFEVVDTFATSGGTDAAAFDVRGAKYLAVSNSLSASLRFRTDTLIYRFSPR